MRLLLLALLLSTAASAQPALDWFTPFPEYAGGQGHHLKAHAVHTDGTVYVAANNGTTFYLTRYASDGAVLWTLVHQAPGAGAGPGGHVLLAVASDGSAYVVSTVTAGSATFADLYVMKASAGGTFEWEVVRDGPMSGDHPAGQPGNNWGETDYVADAAIHPNGNLVVAAQTGYAMSDFWTLMIAPGGSLVWEHAHDVTPDAAVQDMPRTLSIDCDGRIFVFGEAEKQGVYGSDPYLLQLSETGSLVWSARIGNPVANVSRAVDVTAECGGRVYATAQVPRAAGSGSRWVTAAYEPPEVAPVWSVSNDGGGTLGLNHPVALRLDGFGRLYVLGQVDLTDGISTQTVRYHSASGALEWARVNSYSTDGYTREPAGLAVDTSGVYVLDHSPTLPRNLQLRKYSVAGEVEWGMNYPSTQASRRAGPSTPPHGPDNVASLHGQGGLVARIEVGGTLGLARYIVGEQAEVAEVQVMHGAAALAGFGPVEIYVNQPPDATTPDAVVTYPNGTALLTLPAHQEVPVRVRLQNPPPFGLPQEVTLVAPPLAPGRHVVTVTGIPPQILALFAPNPDGVDRSLRLIVAPLEEDPARGAPVRVVVTHAVTDAPSVNVVVAETGQVLAQNLPYGEAAPAATLAPGIYRIEVRRASDGALVEAVRFDLTDAAGEARPLTITGFLDPAQNQGGPALQFVALDETGETDGGEVVTSTEAPASASALRLALFPNPASGEASVSFATDRAGLVRLALYDVLGREVLALADEAVPAGTHRIALDVSALAPGAYVLRLSTSGSVDTRRFTVVR